MQAPIATVLSFLSMADWHVDESYNILDSKELSESDISLCSDEISIYFPSRSEGDSDIEMQQLRPPILLLWLNLQLIF